MSLELIGDGHRKALILHGLLGSARNWHGIARRMVRRWPDWRFILADLRGHGHSREASPPHDLAACSEDMESVAAEAGWPETVIGHSFGGKVALQFAADHGENLDAVWLLDSPPGPRQAGDTGSSALAGMIEVLKSIPVPVARRADVTTALRARGVPDVLAGWMATNLRSVGADAYDWNFDVATVELLLADYGRADFYPWLEEPREGPAIHVVRAGQSDRWSGEDLALLDRLASAGRLQVHLLASAGHWLHVDDPDRLMIAMDATFGAPALAEDADSE
jgi:pimeloyl-ACP methyl ester carboxylesterase